MSPQSRNFRESCGVRHSIRGLVTHNVCLTSWDAQINPTVRAPSPPAGSQHLTLQVDVAQTNLTHLKKATPALNSNHTIWPELNKDVMLHHQLEKPSQASSATSEDCQNSECLHKFPLRMASDICATSIKPFLRKRNSEFNFYFPKFHGKTEFRFHLTSPIVRL